MDLSEPLEKMLPYLGISLEGKFKPAHVFKEEDPLGISVINRRIEGNFFESQNDSFFRIFTVAENVKQQHGSKFVFFVISNT